jgi:hypothetical protein
MNNIEPLWDSKKARKAGYCIVSRKKPTLAARIDRKDWKEYMASKHPGGMDWVKFLAKDAADYYRRCYSKDIVVVPASWTKKLPNSNDGSTEFMPYVE